MFFKRKLIKSYNVHANNQCLSLEKRKMETRFHIVWDQHMGIRNDNLVVRYDVLRNLNKYRTGGRLVKMIHT